MQRPWKFISRRLVQTVTLLAFLVLLQGMSRAQTPVSGPTLAFSPGSDIAAAGNPADFTYANGVTPTPATYVGPAVGVVPQSGGFFATASDKYGNVYVSDGFGGNIVRVIASGNGPIPVLPSVNPQAGYAYTVAGTGENASGPLPASCPGTDTFGDGCAAMQAAFGGYVLGIAVDSYGNVYIADNNNGLIREVYAGNSVIPGVASPQVGYIYVVAGSLNATGSVTVAGTNGPATGGFFGYPLYLAVDPSGNIYTVAWDENYNFILRGISVAGNLAGVSNPTNGYAYTIVGTKGKVMDGIPASSSGFAGNSNSSAPNGIATDSSGNVYVSDQYGIRVIYVGGSVPGLNSTSLNQGDIYTMAGTLNGTGSVNLPAFPGSAAAAGQSIFNYFSPSGITFDPAGNLYVTTTSTAGRVYKIDPSGNLTSIYGTGTNGCAAQVDAIGDGCDSGGIAGTYGVAVDAQGNIWTPDQAYLVLHEQNVVAPSLYFGYGGNAVKTAPTPQPLVIYNTGTQPLEITGLALSGSSAFSLVPLSSQPTGSTADCSTANTSPLTLPAGGSCATQIEFKNYTGTDNATGTLTVTSNSTNATGGTNVIQLTGESAANAALTAIQVTLTSSVPSNSISAGTTETFSYQVACNNCASPPANAITGTLTLYSGNTQIDSPQTVDLASSNRGTFNFSSELLPTGNDLIYAVYSGDNQHYAPAQSAQALVDVTGANTTTTLTPPSPATIATGSSVTLSAKVVLATGATAPTGEAAPTGDVLFKSGSTVLGTGTISGGTAQITTPDLTTAGTDTFTAIYAGDNYFNTSTSGAVTVNVVQPVNTTTAVSAMPTGIAEGASVTLSATVTPASGTTAPSSGTVQFYNNGTALGSPVNVVSGSGNTVTAMTSVTTLPEGANAITAVYSGSTDKLFNASPTSAAVTVTVGLPATTTTLTPATGSITYGSSYTFTVAVAAQVGNTVPAGTVSFVAGSTPLGSATLNSGTATFTTTQLPGGPSTVNDTVAATYNDPTNTFASSTGTASVSVAPLATTTATPTSSNLNPVSGQTLTLAVSVAAQGSSLTPTGTVTFYNGTTTLCSANLSNGSANCSTSLQQGAASITAVYVGGNGFATSTSSALSLNVAAPPSSTATALSASTTTASTTQPVSFTATVTNTTAGATGTPNGAVTFQSGTTVLGTSGLNGSGVATLTYTFTNTGAYPVVAIYQGNSSYTGSTSTSAVTITVTKALEASTTALTLSASAVQQGQNVTFTATVGPNSPITPSGNVNFMSGDTLLGTGTLYGGIATYSTSSLGVGNYSVTAVYPGDVNFSGSSSTSSALSVAAPTPSFTLIATPTSITLQSGQSGSAIITLIPTYDYAGTIALSCGTLPSNVTCSFSPATLAADGKNDTVQSTLTISTSNGMAQLHQPASFWHGRNNAVLSAALFFLPAGLLGLGFFDKRKGLGRYLSLAVLVFLGTGLVALSGCGGSNGGSSTDAAKGTAQITVTAAGSAGSQSQTVNLSVTIQ